MARQLMSDAEWAFFEPFITAMRGPGERRPANHRRVLDGIFWIARTGAPWGDLPVVHPEVCNFCGAGLSALPGL